MPVAWRHMTDMTFIKHLVWPQMPDMTWHQMPGSHFKYISIVLLFFVIGFAAKWQSNVLFPCTGYHHHCHRAGKDVCPGVTIQCIGPMYRVPSSLSQSGQRCVPGVAIQYIVPMHRVPSSPSLSGQRCVPGSDNPMYCSHVQGTIITVTERAKMCAREWQSNVLFPCTGYHHHRHRAGKDVCPGVTIQCIVPMYRVPSSLSQSGQRCVPGSDNPMYCSHVQGTIITVTERAKMCAGSDNPMYCSHVQGTIITVTERAKMCAREWQSNVLFPCTGYHHHCHRAGKDVCPGVTIQCIVPMYRVPSSLSQSGQRCVPGSDNPMYCSHVQGTIITVTERAKMYAGSDNPMYCSHVQGTITIVTERAKMCAREWQSNVLVPCTGYHHHCHRAGKDVCPGVTIQCIGPMYRVPSSLSQSGQRCVPGSDNPMYWSHVQGTIITVTERAKMCAREWQSNVLVPCTGYHHHCHRAGKDVCPGVTIQCIGPMYRVPSSLSQSGQRCVPGSDNPMYCSHVQGTIIIVTERAKMCAREWQYNVLFPCTGYHHHCHRAGKDVCPGVTIQYIGPMHRVPSSLSQSGQRCVSGSDNPIYWSHAQGTIITVTERAKMCAREWQYNVLFPCTGYHHHCHRAGKDVCPGVTIQYIGPMHRVPSSLSQRGQRCVPGSDNPMYCSHAQGTIITVTERAKMCAREWQYNVLFPCTGYHHHHHRAGKDVCPGVAIQCIVPMYRVPSSLSQSGQRCVSGSDNPIYWSHAQGTIIIVTERAKMCAREWQYNVLFPCTGYHHHRHRAGKGVCPGVTIQCIVPMYRVPSSPSQSGQICVPGSGNTMYCSHVQGTIITVTERAKMCAREWQSNILFPCTGYHHHCHRAGKDVCPGVTIQYIGPMHRVPSSSSQRGQRCVPGSGNPMYCSHVQGTIIIVTERAKMCAREWQYNVLFPCTGYHHHRHRAGKDVCLGVTIQYIVPMYRVPSSSSQSGQRCVPGSGNTMYCSHAQGTIITVTERAKMCAREWQYNVLFPCTGYHHHHHRAGKDVCPGVAIQCIVPMHRVPSSLSQSGQRCVPGVAIQCIVPMYRVPSSPSQSGQRCVPGSGNTMYCSHVQGTIITVTERAKMCAREWQYIVWRTRDKKTLNTWTQWHSEGYLPSLIEKNIDQHFST